MPLENRQNKSNVDNKAGKADIAQADNANKDTNSDKGTVAVGRKRRRWPLIVGGIVVILILFSGVGFVTATALEDQDTFCISCHTIPEVTYYNRAYMALDHGDTVPVTDLASAHYHLSQKDGKTPFSCIDCHRGDTGLSDRASAIILGARDALVYVAGREDPTIEKTQISEAWLANAACINCHTDTLLNATGFQNHYHTALPETAALIRNGAQFKLSSDISGLPDANQALQAWTRPIDVALNCTSCHVAHETIANGASNLYIRQKTVNDACVTCHLAAGQGPRDLNGLTTTGTPTPPPSAGSENF